MTLCKGKWSMIRKYSKKLHQTGSYNSADGEPVRNDITAYIKEHLTDN